MFLLPADIDECKLNVSRCDHDCFDTAGSYACICQVGYTLAEDRRTCNGEQNIINIIRVLPFII